MKPNGRPCRPIGENLEETASGLKDQAEIIKLIGWADQAATIEEMANRLEAIAKMIRSGKTETHTVAAFPQRNY
jgi:hypothetical protein